MSGWVAGAVVVGSVISSQAQKSSANKAASAQERSAQLGIDQQNKQFEAIQKLLSPYSSAGVGGGGSSPQSVIGLYQKYMGRNPNQDTLKNWVGQINSGEKTLDDVERLISSGPGAQQYALSGNGPPQTKGSLAAQQDLLGLNGMKAQQGAISGIENSPQFTSMMQQGENAILQNASATGGLRGGNTQGALAQFRPALLNGLIDQQYQRLGGLTSIGQNAAAGVGNAGMNTGNQITNLLGQQGAAQAGNAMAQGQAKANMYSGISSGIGTFAGMGGFGGGSGPTGIGVSSPYGADGANFAVSPGTASTAMPSSFNPYAF